jgi:hypothetical protein
VTESLTGIENACHRISIPSGDSLDSYPAGRRESASNHLRQLRKKSPDRGAIRKSSLPISLRAGKQARLLDLRLFHTLEKRESSTLRGLGLLRRPLSQAMAPQ